MSVKLLTSEYKETKPNILQKKFYYLRNPKTYNTKHVYRPGRKEMSYLKFLKKFVGELFTYFETQNPQNCEVGNVLIM